MSLTRLTLPVYELSCKSHRPLGDVAEAIDAVDSIVVAAATPDESSGVLCVAAAAGPSHFRWRVSGRCCGRSDVV